MCHSEQEENIYFSFKLSGFSRAFCHSFTASAVISSLAEIIDFCQISFPSMLQEPPHSYDFKTKIPEQRINRCFCNAENLEVEPFIDKSKTHFNTMLKSQHRGVGGRKEEEKNVKSILIFPCCLNLKIFINNTFFEDSLSSTDFKSLENFQLH